MTKQLLNTFEILQLSVRFNLFWNLYVLAVQKNGV